VFLLRLGVDVDTIGEDVNVALVGGGDECPRLVEALTLVPAAHREDGLGGAVTSSKYDERGFEIEKTDPVGATTHWVRDERGRILEVVDPLGRRGSVQRDGNGLPVQVIDAAGGVWPAIRDQRGNIETFTDALAPGWCQFTITARTG
jgi:YD repeat-containing protein